MNAHELEKHRVSDSISKLLARCMTSMDMRNLMCKAFRNPRQRPFLARRIGNYIATEVQELIVNASVEKFLGAEAKQIRAEFRKRLCQEHWRIRQLQRQLRERMKAEESRLHFLGKYREIPRPMVEASSTSNSLPKKSGVYFIWQDGEVVYVGQTTDFSRRLLIRSHHALQPGDWISIIQFGVESLDYAEAFYIGICRPVRNFPGRAARIAFNLKTASRL